MISQYRIVKFRLIAREHYFHNILWYNAFHLGFKLKKYTCHVSIYLHDSVAIFATKDTFNIVKILPRPQKQFEIRKYTTNTNMPDVYQFKQHFYCAKKYIFIAFAKYVILCRRIITDCCYLQVVNQLDIFPYDVIRDVETVADVACQPNKGAGSNVPCWLRSISSIR